MTFERISDTRTGGGIYLVNGEKIRTDHVYPPIPARDMDWQAIRDDDEPDDNGNMRFHGHGATEADAIKDLIEQMEDA